MNDENGMDDNIPRPEYDRPGITTNPFVPPEKIPDTLEVPPNTIYVIPDHELYANPPHIKKLTKERDWFTPVFYFCLPLVFGNQHGFILTATYDFVVRWTGLPDLDAIDVHVLEEVKEPNHVLVSSRFGNGILTIQSRNMFRTPKGVNLMIKEPPNYPVDGLSWMNAVVETDNLRRDFTFNIKITRPNFDVYIPKGTPLGCIVPYPRFFLDKFEIKELEDAEELKKAQATSNYFNQERVNYDHGRVRLRYMEGKDIYDQKFDQHQKSLDGGKWWEAVKQGSEAEQKPDDSKPE